MAGKLDEYNRKRDFGKTAEPEGKAATPGGRLKFVVQRHSARTDHFDLRLEWEGVLISWAVPKGPSFDPRDRRLAVETEDHPIEYADFEGTIPEGEYGGGTVMIWDEGYWEPLGDAGKGLAEGALEIMLYGKRLKGRWALVRMNAKAPGQKKNWLLIKGKDEYASDDGGMSGSAASVRTGRTMEEISRGAEPKNGAKNPFNDVSAQLAKPADRPPEGGEWLYEIKYDGYRIIAFVEGGKARLVSRNGRDYSAGFREIAESLREWAQGRAMVLDGEAVVLDEQGKPDFQALQNHLKGGKRGALTYMAFDLLALDGADLRRGRLIDRKEKLRALIGNAPPNIRFSSHAQGGGKEIYQAACAAGLEGIVAKKAGSVYSGTRNGDWVKVKCRSGQEFVIGGYAISNRKSGISSVLLGVYDGDGLIYSGRAGAGLGDGTVKELEERFRGIVSLVSPFKNVPQPKNGEKIIWLEPLLVARVSFAEWTKDGLLRQASFKGLREDISPADVRREKDMGGDTGDPELSPREEKQMDENRTEIIIKGVRITHPDKKMYEDPPVTKEDVANYYAAAAERMLPYVSGRILSVIRCPEGVSGECFFKKHPGPGAKGTINVPVKGKGGETKDYFYIEDAFGLISEVQMGTLEFHIWGSRAAQIESPDMMVFDLDPGEDLGPDRIREGVRDLKRVLDELSLVSFLKTSGGKGYHVVIPLSPSAGWDAFSGFAKLVAEVMERRWPERYTSNMRKGERKGKIFVDWVRNSRSATSIAPYSLRARPGAPVSMPVFWEELDSVAPGGVNIQNARERIRREDPWKGFFDTNQRIKGEKLV